MLSRLRAHAAAASLALAALTVIGLGLACGSVAAQAPAFPQEDMGKPPATNVDGAWATTYRDSGGEHPSAVTLVQSGGVVTGTSSAGGNTSELSGTMQGRTIAGVWTYSSGLISVSGPFQLTVDADGGEFTGWFDVPGGERCRWNGTRPGHVARAPSMPPSDSSNGPGCTRDADCKGNRVCNAGRCEVEGGPARTGGSAAGTRAGTAAFKAVAGQPQPGSYALIVGIEHYRDVIAADGAKRDAERFAALATTTLGMRAENVHTAIDDHATKSDIERELGWLRDNVKANGRVFFFYSGHGAPDAAAGTPYILPYDGDAKFIDKTGIPLATVLKALGDTKAKEVLAVVDSCFSGAGGRSVLPKGARPLVRVAAAPAVAHVSLFSAASGSEISGPASDGDGGLFSKLVAEGLGTGAADIDGDSQVTLRELADWVTPRAAREAKKSGREQTPSVAVAAGARAEDFALAYGLAK